MEQKNTDVKVPLISKIAYGMGDVGCNFSWMFVGNFLMIFYTDVFGIGMGAVFTAVFVFFGKPLAAIFLEDEVLIEQTGYFLKILCLSAPALGIINTMTSYFQALGKAIKSLTITVLRNAVLFIPGVILLNYIWKLNGVIAAQPVVEAVLMLICIAMFFKDKKSDAN